MLKRLSRWNEWGNLVDELRILRYTDGPLVDARIARITARIEQLEAEHEAAGPISFRKPAPMHLRAVAAPCYPVVRHEPFADAARQVLGVAIVAMLLGALWN